jgi:formylglycine-generating enzyme required for sulfatase activity/tRNA A-37 threonylcarbamoyl transferase component Bud32
VAAPNNAEDLPDDTIVGDPRAQQSSGSRTGSTRGGSSSSASSSHSTSKGGTKRRAPEGPDAHSGRLLGGCEIKSVLGKGGMATVYLAIQQGLDREVAVKILSSRLTQKKREVDQFFREAKTIAALEHPNIVSIYGVGEQDETYFLILQLIRGGSLMDYLREQKDTKVPIETAVEYTKQIAKGLHVAHAKGIIHRDIKPHNVLVHGDVLKITDFGLAMIDDGSGGAFGKGRVVGTPHYMSPEQVDGKPVDGRTDLYALGCSLYQMITGAPPFAASSTIDLLLKHVSERPVPPHEREPKCPEWLSKVTLRLIAKDAEARYQTGQELIDDLSSGGSQASAALVAEPEPEPETESILLQAAPPPLKAAPVRARRSPLVAYGAILVFGLAVGLAAAGHSAVNAVLADEEVKDYSQDRVQLLEEGAERALARLEKELVEKKASHPVAAARLRTFAAKHEGRGAAKAALTKAKDHEQAAQEARTKAFREGLEGVDAALVAKDYGPALDLIAALEPKLETDQERAEVKKRREATEGKLAKRGLAWVSPGEFLLGEGETQVSRYADGFYVQVREVSCGDYAEFVAATGAAAPAGWVDGEPAPQDRERPVTNVSAEDANAYAKWLGMRLLLSSEWEKAARGTDGRRWPWGNEFDPKRCRWGLEVDLSPCGATASDVSPYGCLDMAGNAREITILRRAGRTLRVRVRGGGIGTEAFLNTRATFALSGLSPDARDPSLGFRCASDKLPPVKKGGR